MKPALKTLCIVGAGLLVIGFVLSMISFSILGFDASRLDGLSSYAQQIASFPTDSINEIQTDLHNKKVIVQATTNSQIKVTYHESKYDVFDCKIVDDKIVIKNQLTVKWFSSFKFGIFFGLSSQDEVIIEVPSSYITNYSIHSSNGSVTFENINQAKKIEIDSSNGSIHLGNLLCDNLDLRTTNSKIELDDVSAKNKIYGKTNNGSISLSKVGGADINLKTNNSSISLINVVAPNALTAQTSNGKIHCDRIDSNDIYLKTSNSSIKGTITGKSEDYSIQSHTSNGSNNLPTNWGSGSKKLDVKTSNGSIKIEFSE